MKKFKVVYFDCRPKHLPRIFDTRQVEAVNANSAIEAAFPEILSLHRKWLSAGDDDFACMGVPGLCGLEATLEK